MSSRSHASDVLLELRPETLARLVTRAERLAFWINQYNALMVAGIRALGLRHSVWESPGLFDGVRLRVGGETFTLDAIEHGILRGNRPHPVTMTPLLAEDDPRARHAIAPMDPRVHFAISCGARSCPAIRHYEAAGLDAELDDATWRFINQEVGCQGEQLRLPELFRWFPHDFDDAPGGLAGFLGSYLANGPARSVLFRRGLADVVYSSWDWRLHPALAG